MVKGCIPGPTGDSMMVNGLMEGSMELENMFLKMDNIEKDIGRMGKGRNGWMKIFKEIDELIII